MSSISPRETLDRQIQHLLDEVLVMGSMVEEAVKESVEALKRRDVVLVCCLPAAQDYLLVVFDHCLPPSLLAGLDPGLLEGILYVRVTEGMGRSPQFGVGGEGLG